MTYSYLKPRLAKLVPELADNETALRLALPAAIGGATGLGALAYNTVAPLDIDPVAAAIGSGLSFGTRQGSPYSYAGLAALGLESARYANNAVTDGVDIQSSPGIAMAIGAGALGWREYNKRMPNPSQGGDNISPDGSPSPNPPPSSPPPPKTPRPKPILKPRRQAEPPPEPQPDKYAAAAPPVPYGPAQELPWDVAFTPVSWSTPTTPFHSTGYSWKSDPVDNLQPQIMVTPQTPTQRAYLGPDEIFSVLDELNPRLSQKFREVGLNEKAAQMLGQEGATPEYIQSLAFLEDILPPNSKIGVHNPFNLPVHKDYLTNNDHVQGMGEGVLVVSPSTVSKGRSFLVDNNYLADGSHHPNVNIYPVPDIENILLRGKPDIYDYGFFDRNDNGAYFPTGVGLEGLAEIVSSIKIPPTPPAIPLTVATSPQVVVDDVWQGDLMPTPSNKDRFFFDDTIGRAANPSPAVDDFNTYYNVREQERRRKGGGSFS